MKKILQLSVIICLLSIIFTSHVLAAGVPNDPSAPTCGSSGYCMLAPLPFVSDANGGATITSYIPGLYKLLIGLAGVFAVLKLIYAGIKYMSTDAISGKESSKGDIQDALLGLILAFSSFVILNTINPQLVYLNHDLGLTAETVDQPATGPDGVTVDTGEETAGTAILAGASNGKTWVSDQTERAQFLAAGIDINSLNCATIGQANCTSLTGISSNVLTGLKTLKAGCKCDILLTGGTEYWLHGNRSTELSSNKTPHQPGGTVADLSLQNNSTGVPTPVTTFLRNAPNSVRTVTDPINKCAPGDEKYTFGGGLYVNEIIAGNPPHWHVCFY